MTAIGLYFWAPLFFGWINQSKEGKKSPAGIQVAAETLPGQTNSTADTSADKENKPLPHHWKELLKCMNNDPRTCPAPALTFDRDPFHERKNTIDKTAIEEETKAKTPPVSPASLGMALTSTLIGQNGGIARIGGRTYNLGQTIDVQKEGRSYKFVLAEIHDRRVVLQMEGEQFELSIPEPGASSRMVLGKVEK